MQIRAAIIEKAIFCCNLETIYDRVLKIVSNPMFSGSGIMNITFPVG